MLCCHVCVLLKNSQLYFITPWMTAWRIHTHISRSSGFILNELSEGEHPISCPVIESDFLIEMFAYSDNIFCHNYLRSSNYNTEQWIISKWFSLPRMHYTKQNAFQREAMFPQVISVVSSSNLLHNNNHKTFLLNYIIRDELER